MSISVDNPSAVLERLSAYAGRVLASVRTVSGRMAANWTNTRALWRGRTRDRRFAVLPYNGYQIVNMLAVFVTAVIFLMLVLDPAVTAWRPSLPSSSVPVFRFFNTVGECSWLFAITLLIMIFGLAYDVRGRSGRVRHAHFTRAAAAAYLFAAVAGAGIIASLAKNTIGRARPSQFAEQGAFAFDFLAFVPKWASFPSGHATSIMALAVGLAFLMPRLRFLFLMLGFWVGFARIATGAHYPSDVLAGLALGAVFAWLLARLFAQRRIVFRFDQKGRVVPLPWVRDTVPMLGRRVRTRGVSPGDTSPKGRGRTAR